ncbi:hypothetical protein [Alloprevotella sp. oral taxon 473]|jgi:hypothetical protein BACCOPRO_02754|uniref:hypothetical protein n=1 Tax=Alloprevotella sp. oral taxon 473 TaxID=712469 RepID=UPI000347308D|nr:hypothetical protein [Alloprevotella sp. oral taxon 473]
MGIFSKFFGSSKKSVQDQGWRVGGTEDFMTLIRVYYQAVMASSFGLRDLRALPDLRVFKQTLKVQTLNNKIGLAEKSKCKKMMNEIYGISDSFFKEIDESIKRRCRNVNDMQTYLFQFQGFTQELMMLMGNLMNWKFRLPSFLRGALRNLTEKSVRDIFTKNSWSDASVQKAVMNVRSYQAQLGYSQAWMTEFVYNVLMLAKKEPKTDNKDA